MASVSSSSEELRSQAQIMNTTLSFISSMSLKCAVDLGIPDAVHNHGAPICLPDLAAALSLPPSKSSSIARLMRLLSHAGYFSVRADGSGAEGYVLTPISRRLRERGWTQVRFLLDKVMIMPWLSLSTWFHGEETTGFETTHGMNIWEYAGENPEFNHMLNEGMAHDSDLVTQRIVEHCGTVLYEVPTLVDVGGGNGSMARAIAEAFPLIKCTVFDLPHVVEGMEAGERVEYVGGSMFEAIPPANVLLIKHVLHDFDDEACIKILKICKKVIQSKENRGKLILVEMVLNVVKKDADGSLETQLFYDMEMLTIVGGKERDEQEWKSIFMEAGFASYKITSITEFQCLIEVYP